MSILRNKLWTYSKVVNCTVRKAGLRDKHRGEKNTAEPA